MLGYFLERLQATPDGDGTLLDHSMILYGSSLSDGNEHNYDPLLAGGASGRLKGGRHIRHAPHTPMSNLLLAKPGERGGRPAPRAPRVRATLLTMEPVRVRTPATYEDLLRVPDHMVAEILDGELHVSPRPAPRHAHSSSGLNGQLHGPFDSGRGGPGGWRILFEPELHLGPDIMVPDMAGWRRERLPTLPDTAYFAIAPDWICEVISPSTASMDRVKKLRIYAREGVSHAWLADPLARTLEILQLEGGRWTILATHADHVVVRAEPFDAIDLDLSLLWE
jgi:Uma2 family endonuclease